MKKQLNLVNKKSTSKTIILDQMKESRPLPMGRTEFEEWSDRIISGALLPQPPDEHKEAWIEGQKFALADMMMHLGPTESHKPDAYFIHQLRCAVNKQVAWEIRKELHENRKAREPKEEAKIEEETEKD